MNKNYIDLEFERIGVNKCTCGADSVCFDDNKHTGKWDVTCSTAKCTNLLEGFDNKLLALIGWNEYIEIQIGQIKRAKGFYLDHKGNVV